MASSSSVAPADGSHAAAAPRHSTLFVLLDGLGDVSIGALGDADAAGRTPLSAARTPTLDLLATHGLCGLMDSVEAGQACGSDTAHLSLLGYDPLLYYRGRGAFESMGAGLDMQVGDVAFKSNFATLAALPAGSSANGPRIVSRRRADRAFHSWGVGLCSALDGARLPNFPDIQVSVRYATEHRCGVRLRGPGLSDCVSGTDPLVDGRVLRRCDPTDGTPEARRTAAVVNEVSQVFQRILAAHPINLARSAMGLAVATVVLLRGAGARIQVPPFPVAQGVQRALMVAPTAIIAGLGQSVGFELLPCAGATGDYRTDLRAKARTLLAAMRAPPTTPSTAASPSSAFGFLHVKAIDDAGHDRDIRRKIEWLERADVMLAEVLSELRRPGLGGAADTLWTIVVTGDHSTPVVYGDHSVEPVPFLATAVHHLQGFCEPSAVATYSPHIQSLLTSPAAATFHRLTTQANPVRAFDEIECARGPLGRFPGRECMPLLRRLRQTLMGGDLQSQSQARPLQPSHLHHQPTITCPSRAPPSQLQANLLQRPAIPAATIATSLPIDPACVVGVSPWEQDCAAELATFSPTAGAVLPAAVDVVVIGGGLSGLSTALFLARLGRKCVILERGSIGSGATGRNGGHMHPVNQEERDTVRRLFSVLAEYGVQPADVDFAPKGGLDLEFSTTKLSSTALQVWNAQKVAAAVHSQMFGAAEYHTETGPIHPLKLLCALARILRDHFDTRVWQHTPVRGVESAANGEWAVLTERGPIRARCVVHATNAWVGTLVPALAEHVIPVRNHVLQTTPVLPPTTSADPASAVPLWSGLSMGLPGGFDYLIQRPSHRMVLGGMRYLSPRMDTRIGDATEPMLPYVVERMQAMLPRLFPDVISSRNVAISHLWNGVLGFTSDFVPLVGGVSASAPGQFVLAGFSGHGMPRCSEAGERIARQVVVYLEHGVFTPVQLASKPSPLATVPTEATLHATGISREELRLLHA